MTSPSWVAQISMQDAGALSPLRLIPDLEVCACGENIWLRGPAAEESTALALRKLPGAIRYDASPNGRLTAIGKRVPSAELPDGPWILLSEWLQPEPQTAALPGARPDGVPVCLVRGGPVREPNVILTAAASWRAWAVEAPQVRLDRLTFAICDDGRALIRGLPLPPIRGERYCDVGQIAVPAGFAWSPAVDAGVLRELFGVGGHDGSDALIVLHPSGTYDSIPGHQFVPASRSAVRQSAGGGIRA